MIFITRVRSSASLLPVAHDLVDASFMQPQQDDCCSAAARHQQKRK